MRKVSYPDAVSIDTLQAWWRVQQRDGRSQSWLARKLGVRQPHVARLLSGRVSWHAPSFTRLRALAMLDRRRRSARQLPPHLIELLQDAWGGIRDREETLAVMLESAAAVFEAHRRVRERPEIAHGEAIGTGEALKRAVRRTARSNPDGNLIL